MIIICLHCNKFFDNQFRVKACPHDTFAVENKHYPESWLANHEPRIGFRDPNYQHTMKSEYMKYQEFLNNNKIKV